MKNVGKNINKVLVVDDSEINLQISKMFLNDLGIKNIMVAETGYAALDACWESDIALVLLDIDLPDISGIEVYLRLRNRPQGKSLPIVACTSNALYREPCLQAGFNDFLVKPFTPTELEVMLQRVLK